MTEHAAPRQGGRPSPLLRIDAPSGVKLSTQAAHLLSEHRHWSTRAIELSEKYDSEKVLYFRRNARADRDEITLNGMWEKSWTAKKLLAQGEWAHRKADTYGIAFLVELQISLLLS